jgi:cysteinyl-tRNA synthetase
MQFYNTLSRHKDTLKPLEDSTVRLYTCGLTVYSQPHIGNWVGYIYWDVLVRTLTHAGYSVKRVQNITDVGHLVSDDDSGEDKMEKGARSEGVSAWDIANKYIAIAEQEAKKLGLLPPTITARATDYIAQQIAFVRTLEEKGYTYIIPDEGVYFDTTKLTDYGKLAQLDTAGLQAGARVAISGKKNPTDFALWKFSPKNAKRDMEWESPWGTGFPGWHLECSVIARETLGDQIDIHTGGIDHIPVHHTNEIAQSEAVTGKSFAQIWLHNNHLKVDGQKMSKSLGNIITLADIERQGYSLAAFKLFVLSKHYSTEGNFTWENLESARHALQNLYAWADLSFQNLTNETLTQQYSTLEKEFISSVEDDLDTHKAVTILHQMRKLSDELGADSKAIKKAVDLVDTLLGISLAGEPLTTAQETLLKQRAQARAEKDWTASDNLRDELAKQNIIVRDQADQQLWSRIRV